MSLSHSDHRLLRGLVASLSLLAACGEDGGSQNENEVITTVMLTFTPAGGGAPIVAGFNDLDGDGGAAPTIDPIHLIKATTYTGRVTFEDRLANPAEDVTLEVRAEAVDHQVFFTGTAVNGPASNQPTAPLFHVYLDSDARGLPIGLTSSFVAGTGAGQLTVTLRHLPPVNREAIKNGGSAEAVFKSGGFATLGGTTDAQVTFPVTVP